MRPFHYRLGRRGIALLLFAYLDAVIGYSLLDASTRAQTAAIPSYKVVIMLAPLLVWAFIWIAAGMACLVSAFLRDDRWGFAAASAVFIVWAVSFLISWAAYGADRGWLAAATWAVLAMLVLDCAGWREVPRE